MLRALAVLGLIVLAGCAGTSLDSGLGQGKTDDGHAVPSLTGSVDAPPSDQWSMLIDSYGGSEDDPNCPGAGPSSPREGYREGDFMEEWIHLEVMNPGTENVPPHRTAFVGLLTDGSEVAPCRQNYRDLEGGETVPQSLWFLIPYRGEGTTPFVDRVALEIDGVRVAQADIRDSRQDEAERAVQEAQEKEWDAQAKVALSFNKDGSRRTLTVVQVAYPHVWDEYRITNCALDRKSTSEAVAQGDVLVCQSGIAKIDHIASGRLVYETAFT